jgi:hypothetical protein
MVAKTMALEGEGVCETIAPTNLSKFWFVMKYVGTCPSVQGDPTGVCGDVNRVLARDGNSSVNLASQGHCAGVFIDI